MSDRIQFDGDLEHLDEFVVHGATVHLEAMGRAHDWCLIISRDDGLLLQLHVGDAQIVHTERADLLDTKIGEPLLGCGHEWRTRDERRHGCDHTRGAHPKRHKCECGRTTTEGVSE